MTVADDYVKLQRKVGIALIILFIALIIFLSYFLIFYAKPCVDTDGKCFVDAMSNCDRVSWIKEDSQSSWLYTIEGNTQDESCKVNIKLLKVKSGPLESEKLQGKDMTCIVRKGQTQFPEKDISKCSGELKEVLQELIIQRMHDYLIQNFGEIKDEFKNL